MSSDNPIVFGEIIENQVYTERSGVYGILSNDEKQVGIIKTPRGYILPGGGIESGESHQHCLIREFEEETGIAVDVGDFIGTAILYGFSPNSHQFLKVIGHFYDVKKIHSNLVKIEADHELVWFSEVDAVQTLKLEHQAWAVAEAFSRCGFQD